MTTTARGGHLSRHSDKQPSETIYATPRSQPFAPQYKDFASALADHINRFERSSRHRLANLGNRLTAIGEYWSADKSWGKRSDDDLAQWPSIHADDLAHLERGLRANLASVDRCNEVLAHNLDVSRKQLAREIKMAQRLESSNVPYGPVLVPVGKKLPSRAAAIGYALLGEYSIWLPTRPTLQIGLIAVKLVSNNPWSPLDNLLCALGEPCPDLKGDVRRLVTRKLLLQAPLRFRSDAGEGGQ